MLLVSFSKKDNPSEKIVIVEEELDCIDRDGIGKLEDLLFLLNLEPDEYRY